MFSVLLVSSFIFKSNRVDEISLSDFTIPCEKINHSGKIGSLEVKIGNLEVKTGKIGADYMVILFFSSSILAVTAW